jgi:hypothetical protein
LRARAAKSIALITIKNNKDRLVSHKKIAPCAQEDESLDAQFEG